MIRTLFWPSRRATGRGARMTGHAPGGSSRVSPPPTRCISSILMRRTQGGSSFVGGMRRAGFRGRGKTWRPRNAGLPNTNIWCVGSDPDIPGRLYAAPHQSAVHVSDDFGRTWRKSWFESATVWRFCVRAPACRGGGSPMKPSPAHRSVFVCGRRRAGRRSDAGGAPRRIPARAREVAHCGGRSSQRSRDFKSVSGQRPAGFHGVAAAAGRPHSIGLADGGGSWCGSPPATCSGCSSVWQ